MIKLFLFVLLNSILPFADVGTDAATFYDLNENGQRLWACVTCYFMWNPFVLHLLDFIYKFLKALWKQKLRQTCLGKKVSAYIFSFLKDSARPYLIYVIYVNEYSFWACFANKCIRLCAAHHQRLLVSPLMLTGCT